MEHDDKTIAENKIIDKYKALFLSSRDAVVTLEPPSWKFTTANPAAIAMFRAKDEADFLRYPPWELSPHLQPDGLESMGKAMEMIDQARQNGSNLFEWTHQTTSGEEFPAEVFLSKVEQDGKAYLHALIRDISDRKKLEKQIKESAEEKFKIIFNSTNDGMLVVEASGNRFLLANSAISKMLGYSVEELQKLSIADIHPQESLPHVMEQFAKQSKKEISIASELPVKRKDGTLFYADVNSSDVIIDGKKYILGVFRDTTDRRMAEQKIERLTKLYAALSECNQAIVRAGDEKELFEKNCHNLVEFGGMQMAWIGVVDTETQLVQVAASAGRGIEYLKDIKISVDVSSPLGHGPTGVAIREKHPFWSQDFQKDPATEPWHARGTTAGWKASAALPLYKNGEVVGALNLYAGEINAFDDDAERLMTEVARDISYALDNFARTIETKRAEEQLRLSHATYQGIINGITEAIYIQDENGIFLDVNTPSEKMYGYEKKDFIGKSPEFLSAPGKNDLAKIAAFVRKAYAGEPQTFEFWGLRKNGSIFPKEVSLTAGTYFGKKCVVAVARETTERKKEEKALQDRLEEIEKLNKFMVGRELKMVELKNEIEKLKKK